MFRGDHPVLGQVLGTASGHARRLGHGRVGTEHLLLALVDAPPVAAVLTDHGVTSSGLEAAIQLAGPSGAGAAADRISLRALGVEVDGLLVPELLDRAPAQEPLLPLGAKQSRRRAARLSPPLGLDTQAAYAASLRLALARRERDHRVEHLALTLLALDPGVDWILTTAEISTHSLLAALATAFPPPHRNPLLRLERALGRPARHRDIIRRYHHTTGRPPTTPAALNTLIHQPTGT
ncbi:Clp protease N-terminal domain-containing protein [Actinokineospora enzanensis]|uniref:Clp protease N-terminal domain-containing protein n=1 Tax=Actinokineospora enzanensis TaxID=155975 RepID=UPI000A010468|nr:Clp protease N-terminal domain-containing protein [Actinokineospora enzanensis]